jgi:urea transport system permease protein
MHQSFMRLVALLSFFIAATAHASEGDVSEAVKKLTSSEAAEVTKGVELLGTIESVRALPILAAMEENSLQVDQSGRLFIRGDGADLVEAVSGQVKVAAQPLRDVVQNNRVRRSLGVALARARLSSPDVTIRRTSAESLSGDFPDEETTKIVRQLLITEKDEETREFMGLALAKVDISSESPELRIQAARAIAASDDISLEPTLLNLVGQASPVENREKIPEVRVEMKKALTSIQRRVFLINSVANTIYGLSLGSVLVLAALGLAITFGLMGVINMAHGEMIMLGAYSTFFVREQFLAISPSAAEWYLLVAIPFAFMVTFGVGMLLERTVIRFLYGRPLETLLATWGLSLILIQVIRMIFGAQNVTVANPDWLSGGFKLMPALVVPYSRIAVLCFTALVVGFVAYVLRGTSVGLKVRAVTQNRPIASSLGIPTHRIDMYTFGLGSGLAGLGGVALSQLGNVGPELGQQHIIDSFMVVVLGGVGNILGTIVAGVGLGIANKVLEPGVGAVLGKIILLGMLILFIQWRPQGLFALKGRSAGD